MSLFKSLLVTFFVLFPFLLFLALRLDGVTADMSNSDAARWHRRSQDFFYALKNKDFVQTYQSYHPGVTLMWLSSGVVAGLKLQAMLTNTEFKTLENTDGYLMIDGTTKIVLVITLFILLIIQYRYIQLLYDTVVALIFVYLAAVEPYFIGINRWYHLTSLEVFLSFLSFLSLIACFEFKKRSYAIKSGVFMGLAVLTKFSSLTLVPVLFVIFLIYAYKNKKVPFATTFYVKAFLSFCVAALFTFVLLFPAVWVQPLTVFQKLFSAAVNASAGDYGSVFYAELHPYLYYFVILAYKFSPITLAILALGFIKSFKWRDNIIFYMVGYIIFELALLSIFEQKIERYILAIMPAVFLVCAVTLSRAHRKLLALSLIVILISLVHTYIAYRPVYSAYYSPAFGGPKAADFLKIYDDNGEYFAGAARYLNTKGRDINVYVPYNVESFSYYFKGNLKKALTPDTDYVLVSTDSRRVDKATYTICNKPDGVFLNNGLWAAVIYQCANDR